MRLSQFAKMIFVPCTAFVFIAVSLLAVPVAAQGVDLSDPNPFGDEPTAGGPGVGGPGAEGELGAEPEQQQTAKEVFDEASQLFDDGKLDEANVLLTRILNASPNYVPAAILRGKLFSEMKEPGLALESFALAVNYGARFEPSVFAEALGERGKVLMQQGQFQEAFDDFNAAVTSSPSDPEYLYLRGKAALRLPAPGFGGGTGQENVSQAISSLTRAILIKPDYAEAHAERGTAYSAGNRYEEAIADFQKAVEINGDTTNFQAQLGSVLSRRAAFESRRPNADKNQVVQDYQNAITAFSNYLKVEGEKSRADFEDAEIDVYRPGQVYMERASARLALAKELGGTGQNSLYQAAIADTDKAYAYDKISQAAVNAMFQKGIAQRLMGDLDAAVDSFTDVLDLVPQLSEANIRRGICFYYQGDNSSARRDFEQAMGNSETRDGRAEFWIGVTFAKEGDYETATRHYSRSIRLNPRYKPAYSNRGLAFMQLKQYRRAADDFNELVRRNRKDSIAKQRRDQARQMMQR